MTKAFKKLKEEFTKAPILTMFNLEILIMLETDALDYAIRACIN